MHNDLKHIKRPDLKNLVRDHWEKEPCGSRYGKSGDDKSFFTEMRRSRYALEPHIEAFQEADSCEGAMVLEIGIGSGCDFIAWPRNNARAVGIDLTRASVEMTLRHLETEGFGLGQANLAQADAEHLPFRDESFDMVYSYGVLHHSPDTVRGLCEAARVLKPGGKARIMIYHHPSWTGMLLWIYHALFKGRIFKGMRRVVYEHLESPGTKSYTVKETGELMKECGFRDVRIEARLGPGDLLLIEPSRRYGNGLVRLMFRLWPRRGIRAIGHSMGLLMMIRAVKAG
jgi:ubiquinone/menaquinone biosynthesis C-methylase UbiE